MGGTPDCLGRHISTQSWSTGFDVCERFYAKRRAVMDTGTPSRGLEGKKGLVLGIANQHSIAYGCAKAFRSLGAELAITYLNDKARPFVEPLARELEAPIFLPLDVQAEGQMERVFEQIGKTWGKLDFALHSIAYAPKADL